MAEQIVIDSAFILQKHITDSIPAGSKNLKINICKIIITEMTQIPDSSKSKKGSRKPALWKNFSNKITIERILSIIFADARLSMALEEEYL